MTRADTDSPIALLNPISDSAAAASVSTETSAALIADILEVRAPARRHAVGTPVPVRRRRGLAVALACAAVALLGLATTLAGRGPSVAQPADAEIIRGVDAVLHPDSSIVTEAWTAVTRCPTASCRQAMRAGSDPSVQHFSGAEEIRQGHLGNEVVLTQAGQRAGFQTANVDGGHQLYDPRTNTVYAFSDYAHDITPGARAGTFVYRLPSRRPLFWSQPILDDPNASVPPLTLTARQADGLRDGSARVEVLRTARGGYRMRVRPAFRMPDPRPAAFIQAWLGSLKVAGFTVVDGRRAIRLLPVHGRGEYDVAPGTYYPIRSIVFPEDAAGAWGPHPPSAAVRADSASITTTWSVYQVGADTARGQARLSLAARHPDARLDDNNADYLAAWRRAISGD